MTLNECQEVFFDEELLALLGEPTDFGTLTLYTVGVRVERLAGNETFAVVSENNCLQVAGCDELADALAGHVQHLRDGCLRENSVVIAGELEDVSESTHEQCPLGLLPFGKRVDKTKLGGAAHRTTVAKRLPYVKTGFEGWTLMRLLRSACRLTRCRANPTRPR